MLTVYKGKSVKDGTVMALCLFMLELWYKQGMYRIEGVTRLSDKLLKVHGYHFEYQLKDGCVCVCVPQCECVGKCMCECVFVCVCV